MKTEWKKKCTECPLIKQTFVFLKKFNMYCDKRGMFDINYLGTTVKRHIVSSAPTQKCSITK